MKRNLFLFVFIFLFLTAFLFADEFDFTNRFLVANVEGGYCYILIYDNQITFISLINNNINKVLTFYSVDNTDAFVCGNFLVLLKKGRYYFYFLSSILKGNNVDSISDFLKRPGNYYYDGIENIYLINNDIYYTKLNDKNFYRINSNEDGKIILTTNITSRKLIAYSPVIIKKQKDYSDIEKNINLQVVNFNDLKKINDDKTKLKNIENNILKNIPQQPQNFDQIYNYLKVNELEKVYKYNDNEFENFILLAKYTEKEKEKDDLIFKFKENDPGTSPNDDVKSLYDSNKELTEISKPGYLENLQKEAKNTLDSKKSTLENDWGDKEKYKEKFKEFNKADNKTKLEFEWKKEKDKENELKNNWNKIKPTSDLLNTFIKGSRYEKDYSYEEFLLLNNFFNDIMTKYNNEKIKSPIITNMLINLGEEINSRQRSYKNSMDKSNTIYKETLELEEKYKGIEEQHKQKISTLTSKKETAIKNIVKYCIERYRYEIYSNINNKNNTAQLVFTKDYREYIIINESKDDKWIYGFKITDDIKWSANYFQNLGTGKTFVSYVKDGVFIAISDNQLKAYNTSLPNITNPSIPVITINDGIMYLVENNYNAAGNYQYLVTKNGKLLKYSIDINNNKIKTETISQNVNEDDRVIVTDDKAYVISKDGKINGQDGGDIFIKPANSNETAKSLKVKGRKIIIP